MVGASALNGELWMPDWRAEDGLIVDCFVERKGGEVLGSGSEGLTEEEHLAHSMGSASQIRTAAVHRQVIRSKRKWRLIPRIDAIWQVRNISFIFPAVPIYYLSFFSYISRILFL